MHKRMTYASCQLHSLRRVLITYVIKGLDGSKADVIEPIQHSNALIREGVLVDLRVRKDNWDLYW